MEGSDPSPQPLDALSSSPWWTQRVAMGGPLAVRVPGIQNAKLQEVGFYRPGLSVQLCRKARRRLCVHILDY